MLHFQKIILLSTLLFTSAICAEQRYLAPEYIQNVTVLTAEEVVSKILSNPDLVIIDSRKKTEYKKGHIEGAVNVLNTELLEQDLENLVAEKIREILFYCDGERCLRSSDSISKAKAWGYKNLFWFRGGWKEWHEKRFPYVTK
jgi:rhodanese-related sulfurtransferase